MAAPVAIPAACEPTTRDIAGLIAEALHNAGYTIECEASIVHGRVYIGATAKNGQFVIEVELL